MADLSARAVAASATLARAKNPRTELLRELSRLNARWVERLVSRGAGTARYELADDDPYLEALTRLLTGKDATR